MISRKEREATTVLTDVVTLRRNARANFARGAVTANYSGDRSALLGFLNNALATELVCVLRYRRHHFLAKGFASKSVADEFMAHANEELGHLDLLAQRIVQLGGEPDFEPNSLARRSHAEYVDGETLVDMIKVNLVAECIAIDSYRELIAYIGDSDSTTLRLIQAILGVEEQHADELADLLDRGARITR